jgi:ABC-2 type transport system ATP-binding protein
MSRPTELDPQGAREVRGLVRTLAAEASRCSSRGHLLGEVAQMCTHAAVMSAGHIVAHQNFLADLRGVGPAFVCAC